MPVIKREENMSIISKTGNAVGKGVQNATEVLGTTVDGTYTLTKLMKIVQGLIKVAKRLQGNVAKPLQAVSTQFGEATSWLDTLQFFSIMQTLVCKNEKGKYFLFDKNNSLPKRIGQAFLGVCGTASVIEAGRRLGFYNLGRIGKTVVARIPLMPLIIRLTYGVYKVGSGIDCVLKLKDLKSKLNVTYEKNNKWEARNDLIAAVKKGDQAAIESLQKKYETKAKKNVSAEKFASLHTRLDLIKSKQFDSLAKELETKDIAAKKQKWGNVKTEQEFARSRYRVALVECTTKVAATALSIFAEMTALTVLTPLFLTYTTLGLFSDVIAIKKVLMDNKLKAQQSAPKGNGGGGAPTVPSTPIKKFSPSTWSPAAAAAA